MRINTFLAGFPVSIERILYFNHKRRACSVYANGYSEIFKKRGVCLPGSWTSPEFVFNNYR